MTKLLKLILSHKKLLVIVIILFITGIVISFKSGIIGKSLPSYKTQVMSKGDLSTIINASGQVESENQAVLGFLTGGRILYIGFKEGDVVKKGQIIASLDNTQAQEAVSKALATYTSAQSTVIKVLDDIHLTQYGNGGFDNIGSKNETMTQKNTREAAEMTRDGAFQDLQSAKKNLEWSTIVAPFDGIISDISNMEVGQNVVAASMGSISMEGSGELKFVANLDEIDFHRLSVGQVAEILIDAYPDENFSGTITRIGVTAIKLPTGGSVVPVDLTISSPLKLKSGLNGEINVNIVTKKDVLTLPRSAVRKNNGSDYVYLLINKKAEKRNVNVGETLGSKTEIVSGIAEGDQVILGDVKP